MDRNFDDLTERFRRRVYGGLKGQIRLAVLRRDIEKAVDERATLKILDIGGGLGQLSIEFARRGHEVHYNDLSASMLLSAKTDAAQLGLEDSIQWHSGPYQHLSAGDFDVVFCHALLEWLDDPENAIRFCAERLVPGGLLSLNFYNPVGKIYRNLIRGNFDWLDGHEDYASDKGSLTPNRPCSRQSVEQWIKAHGFQLVSTSGIRVFHDYVVEKRGGLQNPQAVLDKELAFSCLEPYKWLGRYLHFCARKNRPL